MVYYVDSKIFCEQSLPMGMTYSPRVSQRITSTSALCLCRYIMQKYGFYPCLIVYIDDITTFCKNKEQCEIVYTEMLQFFPWLGLDINRKKSIPPCQKGQVLGVLIDLVNKRVSLPEKKCKKYMLKLEDLLAYKITSLRGLESVHGSLSYAAGVLPSFRFSLAAISNRFTAAASSKHVANFSDIE